MAKFAAGLIVGFLAGFFLYPLYWSWIAWQEHRQASRRARRIDDVLEDMSQGSNRLEGHREGDFEETDPEAGGAWTDRSMRDAP